MTRTEFIENVNGWYDLLSFCDDENLSTCEDIMDAEGYYEQVDNDIYDRDFPWYDLASRLEDLPEYCDDAYYKCYGRFDYAMLDDDDDFDEYKSNVIDFMDIRGRWDEEENEPEHDAYESAECETEEEIESFEIEDNFDAAGLFSICNGTVQTIRDDEAKREEAERREFEKTLVELNINVNVAF